MAKDTAHTEQVRKLEQKYLRKKRAEKWTDFRKKLPFRIGILLLTLIAAFTVWFMTKPRTVPVPADGLRVYFLDVGQGDAALLCTDSHSILIDGGESDYGEAIVQKLRTLGIERLDCVINSHPHSDHIGGLSAVLEQIPVGTLYLPDIPDTLILTGWSFSKILDIAAKKQIPVRTPFCHDTLSLGVAELEFLCADNSGFEDMNDCSLVCRVTCGERRFLFTGDLSETGEQAMLSAGFTLSADVLKVGHHGSSQSTTSDFLAAVLPEYAVISCGAGNDYGHPAQRTLTALHDAECIVYRTDIDHTIEIETDGREITAVTE